MARKNSIAESGAAKQWRRGSFWGCAVPSGRGIFLVPIRESNRTSFFKSPQYSSSTGSFELRLHLHHNTTTVQGGVWQGHSDE